MTAIDAKAILAHRPPFLFVAEVLRLEPSVEAVAVSNIPCDDMQKMGCVGATVPLWYAAEFLAQTGALAVLAGRPPEEKTLMTGLDQFVMLEGADASLPLRADVQLLGEKRGIGKRHGSVWQGERKVAEGLVWYARST